MEEVEDGGINFGILGLVACIKEDLLQERRRFGNGPQFQEVQKVEIAKSFRSLAVGQLWVETALELGQVGSPPARHPLCKDQSYVQAIKEDFTTVE